jgi:hypothetical protein
MRTTAVRRGITVVAVLVALAAGLAGGGTPAGAAGLTLTATTATTGLTPGATVTVRISGAAARQVVRYGVCAASVPCAPTGSVTTSASGVATVSLKVTGTATYVRGGTTGVKACRPDRCHVAAHPQGQPGGLRTLPLRFVGERVTASIAPTADLVDGQSVYVTGRVRGAEGRTVRAVQSHPACGPTCVATIGQAKVARTGTFAFWAPVRRTLPGGGSCSPKAGSTALGPCQVEVSVAGDPSHGIASALVRFVTPGVTASVTPRSDLVDRQVVQVRGTQPALAGRLVRLRQLACDTTDPFDPICSVGPSVAVRLDAQGRLSTSFTVRRLIGTEDCARSRYPVPDCSIEVAVLNARENPDTQVEVTRTLVFLRPLA